ncbi:MAG TPA: bifunctional 3,4-dihydroxy-2-butanone-4-phosphate synthase/GTP cyclohydrolase II [Legionellales bacterium]|nr:bifunctional 3,4-dihydroxy-2-butanone-4-phosphate synthase/GTP cyclohydrolase II [Legionellales bacterium]
MSNFKDTVENALNVLKAGGMVILVDDEHRENEGDLIMAAEFVTPEAINFMAKYGRGLICLPLTAQKARDLNLSLMTSHNGSPFQTAFTVSIEAASGIDTGISAADRAHTILTATHPHAKASDLISPGHIFPLIARDKGVLERRGQTEGSIDLMKLAGLQPASVICEIMNEDGTMSRRAELDDFSKKHRLPLLSIQDIFNYRVQQQSLVSEEISARIPLAGLSDFKMTVFHNQFDPYEHFVLSKPQKDPKKPPLVRIHSECVTGDLLGSLKCDCGPQLHQSLSMINEEGGFLIYLKQEGRGIGLVNKLKAYVLQESGLDTVDANIKLGLPVDKREYHLAYQFLKFFGYNTIRLMTNNPLKIKALEFYGIAVQERVSLEIETNPENKKYIETKIKKLGHYIQKGQRE